MRVVCLTLTLSSKSFVRWWSELIWVLKDFKQEISGGRRDCRLTWHLTNELIAMTIFSILPTTCVTATLLPSFIVCFIAPIHELGNHANCTIHSLHSKLLCRTRGHNAWSQDGCAVVNCAATVVEDSWKRSPIGISSVCEDIGEAFVDGAEPVVITQTSLNQNELRMSSIVLPWLTPPQLFQQDRQLHLSLIDQRCWNWKRMIIGWF